MSKLLFATALLGSCLFTSLRAQAVIQYKGQGSTTEICAGFADENIVEIQLQGLPEVVPENVNLEYYWTANHQEGTWTWRTNYNKRRMLLPFQGSYGIRARVLYIMLGSTSPYASYWSNQIELNAEDCD